MIRRFYQKHKAKLDLIDGLFVNNTVLERGLVVAPIIVAATSMQNAVTLGIAFVLLTFITVTLSSFIPKRLPYTIRAILHTVLGAIVFIPVSYLLTGIFPEAVYKTGIFFPLLITNSLIVSKSETRFLKKKRPLMMLDLLSHVMGFFLVACVVGAVRELLGNGSFWGISLGIGEPVRFLMFPFGGFILLGFLAAGLQRFRLYLNGKAAPAQVPPEGAKPE